MAFADITITCRDCGKEFIFTAGEQEFYAQKGFLHDPIRCPECRRERKQSIAKRKQRSNDHQSPPRESVRTEVICAACGKPTTVPFVPRGDKPVYCADCFQAMRNT